MPISAKPNTHSQIQSPPQPLHVVSFVCVCVHVCGCAPVQAEFDELSANMGAQPSGAPPDLEASVEEKRSAHNAYMRFYRSFQSTLVDLYRYRVVGS